MRSTRCNLAKEVHFSCSLHLHFLCSLQLVPRIDCVGERHCIDDTFKVGRAPELFSAGFTKIIDIFVNLLIKISTGCSTKL